MFLNQILWLSAVWPSNHAVAANYNLRPILTLMLLQWKCARWELSAEISSEDDFAGCGDAPREGSIQLMML